MSTFAVLIFPLLMVRAAAGRVEGKVTDPTGAAVVGAAVTVTDPVTNQTFTAVTDGQGRLGGLTAGTYVVTISATGFGEGRRNEVKVEEGGIATVDIKLEIAAVEAAVTVTAGGTKPNTDVVYQKLRQIGKSREEFDGPYATSNNLVLERYNQDVSTEDFKRAVEKHMTAEMDMAGNRRMNWFFNQWVYGTEIPSYQFDYQLGADGTLSGQITQSGVSDKFAMLVPVYVDFGKGWQRLGQATLIGNSSVDLGKVNIAKGAKRAAICALNDVLALKIQNNKE